MGHTDFPAAYSHPVRRSALRGLYLDAVINQNHSFVRFLVDFYGLRDKRILDYAGAEGTFAKLFSAYSNDVHGCDLDEHAIERGKTLYGDSVHLFTDDFLDSKLEEDRYDFIFCRSLVPLIKMRFDNTTRPYLQHLVNSLTEAGAAYFIINGNATGRPDADIDTLATGFRHHTIEELHRFYSSVGEVAMINFLGYQVIVVTKSAQTANEIQNRMSTRIMHSLRGIRGHQSVDYYKYKVWLYINRGIDFTVDQLSSLCLEADAKNVWQREDLLRPVDLYASQVSYSGDYEKIKKGVCSRAESVTTLPNNPKFDSEVYLVSGDQESEIGVGIFRNLEEYRLRQS